MVMKKLVFLLAVFCLLSIGAFAQAKTTDYSGEWSLDKGKSTLSRRMQNVESMTMTVTQTEKELKVATAAKRGAPPQGTQGPGGGPPPQGGAPGAGGPPPGGGGPGGGMGGGRGMGGGMGDQTLLYNLEGKETSIEVPGFNGGTATLRTTAKWDGGKLSLATSRVTEMGDIKTTETWELQADGSLKIKRSTDSPRGTDLNDLVFTKKTK